MIDDVLYYTLPCIAELVFPEPAKWKKSWETVYRRLMPHRTSIIQDEERVTSVSELPAMTTTRQSRLFCIKYNSLALPLRGLRQLFSWYPS